jgi:hypothetical protein
VVETRHVNESHKFANATLGGLAGRYRLTPSSTDKAGKKFSLTVDEIALGGGKLDQSTLALIVTAYLRRHGQMHFCVLLVKHHALSLTA